MAWVLVLEYGTTGNSHDDEYIYTHMTLLRVSENNMKS